MPLTLLPGLFKVNDPDAIFRDLCVYVCAPDTTSIAQCVRVFFHCHRFKDYPRFTTLTLLPGFCVCVYLCVACVCTVYVPLTSLPGLCVAMFMSLRPQPWLNVCFTQGDWPIQYFQPPPSSDVEFRRSRHIKHNSERWHRSKTRKSPYMYICSTYPCSMGNRCNVLFVLLLSIILLDYFDPHLSFNPCPF